LAIFVSDNGFLWGQHSLMFKQWPYLESPHVPLYVTWPGRVPEGTVANRLVANIDIAPTIFEASGVEPGYVVDGRSLLSSPARPWLLLEFPESGDTSDPWSAFLSPTRHYIEWSDGFVEDYDLIADPWELEAGNTPDAAIAAALAAARTCAGLACP
jgi:arylsulfatase A-like enzyme